MKMCGAGSILIKGAEMTNMVESMIKIFGSKCKIITIKPKKGSRRVCDYCNTKLVAPGGIVVKKAYLTDYGLMCNGCRGRIRSIAIYKTGEDVSDEEWYKGGGV